MKTLKITLLLACSLFAVSAANAQILQNSLLLGGSMNFDYNSGQTTTTGTTGPNRTVSAPTVINFGLSPRIGYFIADNVALGLNLDFKINSTQDVNTTTQTRLIAGPFARYYFPLSDNIYGFGEVSFGGGIDTRSVIIGEDTTNHRAIEENVSVSNLQLGVGPGLNFFVNDFVAFETLLKYTYGNASYSFKPYGRTETEKHKTISNNISLTLGLQIYLRAVTSGVREGGKE